MYEGLEGETVGVAVFGAGVFFLVRFREALFSASDGPLDVKGCLFGASGWFLASKQGSKIRTQIGKNRSWDRKACRSVSQGVPGTIWDHFGIDLGDVFLMDF